MPNHQRVESRLWRGRRDPAHPAPRRASGSRRGLGLGVLIALLTVVLASPVQAQGRGDLQVAARVLEAGPSRAALAVALGTSAGARGQALAEISRQPAPATGDAAQLARRPRAVVTIAFLRN